jgi:hypothetical protein
MTNQTNDYRLIVASAPDRRDISIEIWYKNYQIADVWDDPGHPVVEFYKAEGPNPVHKVEDILDLLNRAQQELARRPRKKSM